VEHAERVTGFRELARLWEETAEQVTGGYAADLKAYLQSVPRPLFRDWLINTRNPR
jgi:hypothetical protein